MNQTGSVSPLTADALLRLKGADKSAKAYAFLYAAFRKTEIGTSPVRDALDCLVPFIAPYLNKVPGKQVDVAAIQTFLKSEFGFDIPLYALDQLMPTLRNAGLVDFNKHLKVYIGKPTPSSFDTTKAELELDFDRIVAQLGQYADGLGFSVTPPSGSWGDALLAFLKTQPEKPATVVTKIKGALLDPNHVEETIVAGFIKRIYTANTAEFEKLLQIFMGVLIEEFISSVTEVGNVTSAAPLNIFYDTAVLLRVLGCSGNLLRVASEELTRYLQDLGCRIFYFSGNESEVSNILETIIYVKDTGKELEGETAAALADGEVSITDLRMLRNSFPERLAIKNIFPAAEFETEVLKLAKYQIDEIAFQEYLLAQANRSKRAYGIQNRINDAGFLGNVMRLRRGARIRDLAESRFLFVTPNTFLAKAARRFLIEQKVLAPQICPPMLTVGQVAMIAWLMKDKALAPEKAGRELLSSCFAAVHPDAEWFKYFREGIEKVVGPVDEFARDRGSILALQSARRIAQEESFGSASLVRELNLAEILSRGKAESDQLLKGNAEALEKIKRELQAEQQLSEASFAEQMETLRIQTEEEKAEAIKRAGEAARHELRAQFDETNRRRAHLWANRIVASARIVAVLLFLFLGATLLVSKSLGSSSWLLYPIILFSGIISLLEFMHLIGWNVVERRMERIRESVASRILKFISPSDHPRE